MTFPQYYANVMLACLIIFQQDMASCRGDDIVYLKGDAFFHAQINSQNLDQLTNGKAILLKYVLSELDGPSLAAIAGHHSLEIQGDTRKLADNLQAAYKVIRRYYPEEQTLFMDDNGNTEDISINNSVHMFVHNIEFDCKRFSPFLKYSENWIEEIGKLTQQTKAYRYKRFIVDVNCRDWQEASLVPELSVKMHEEEDALSIPSNEVALFLISHEALNEYCLSEYKHGPTLDYPELWRVTSSGATTYKYSSGRWVEVGDPPED